MLPTILPWIQAFIWAFKPTDIVDIRRFPKEEAKALDEEADHLKGRGPAKAAPPPSPHDGSQRLETGRAMLLGFVLLFAYGFIVWLVFFKFRWLKFTIPWGFFSTFFVLHLGIIFLHRLALRRADVDRGARHPADDPAHAEAVGAYARHCRSGRSRTSHVKRGTPLFQFDRRIYEAKVRQLQAQLAQAKQNVLIMKADIQVSTEKVVKLKSELEYARYQQKLSTDLAKSGAGPEEDAQKWSAQVGSSGSGAARPGWRRGRADQGDDHPADESTRRRPSGPGGPWPPCSSG